MVQIRITNDTGTNDQENILFIKRKGFGIGLGLILITEDSCDLLCYRAMLFTYNEIPFLQEISPIATKK